MIMMTMRWRRDVKRCEEKEERKERRGKGEWRG
jgi:hypothetical protein